MAAPHRRTGRPACYEEAVGRQKLLDAARKLLQTVGPLKLTSGQVARRRPAPDWVWSAITLGRCRICSLRWPVSSPMNLSPISHRRRRGMMEQSHGLSGAFTNLCATSSRIPALHPLYARTLSGKAEGARETLDSVAAEGHASLRLIIADGRRSGELRDDFDARLLDIAIIGLCEFIVVGRPILDGWTARGENSDELVKK